MKNLWLATPLALAVTAYFGWVNLTPTPQSSDKRDNCTRLAGEIEARHADGQVISDALLVDARGCAVAFGRDWASRGDQRAAQLRAEGAARVQ